MRTRLIPLVLLASATVLTACGGEDDGGESGASADEAGCQSVYENAGEMAAGNGDAARQLLDDLGDAGPDDNYSTAVSGHFQILAADALVLTSGAPNPSAANHVRAARTACDNLGSE